MPGKKTPRMQLTYEQFIRSNFENAVALAKTMEKELGKARAHGIIYRSRVEGDIASARARVKGKPIQAFEEFKALMREIHSTQVARNLFEITFPVENDREVEFRTTRCVLASVFRAMGEEELGYLMCCKPDHESTPAFCSRVGLRRTKTLMMGDSYCDTTYFWS